MYNSNCNEDGHLVFGACNANCYEDGNPISLVLKSLRGDMVHKEGATYIVLDQSFVDFNTATCAIMNSIPLVNSHKANVDIEVMGGDTGG
jgi:hypothetical protein